MRKNPHQLGSVVSTPPYGYVRRPGGRWAYDPDPKVRRTLHRVFRLSRTPGGLLNVMHALTARSRRGHNRS